MVPSVVGPAQAIGQGVVRRFTHIEYNNTVRALLGTTLTPADSFPGDVGADGFEDGTRIDLRRQGHLDEDTVDGFLLVQLVDQGEQFGGGDGGGGRVLFAVNSEVMAGFDLVADVDFASRVFADEDDGESGRALQGRHARFGLGQNLVSDFDAVKNQALNPRGLGRQAVFDAETIHQRAQGNDAERGERHLRFHGESEVSDPQSDDDVENREQGP